MRIVFLNPCGQLGGAETSLLEVLASLRAMAPEWELHLVLGEDGPFAAEARQRGAQVMVEPFPASLAGLGDSGQPPLQVAASLMRAAFATAGYRRRLARILQGLCPDVVHTNGFKMHLLGAWSRPRSALLVWHVHDYVSQRRLMSRFLRFCQGACSVAIANSRSVERDIRKSLPGLRVVPIYNSVDLKRFSPAGPVLDLDKLAQLEPAPDGAVRVGLVGTFARWKGHQVFLEALAQLPSALNVRGYIIGAPIYQTGNSQWSLAELERKAAHLGLGSRLGFTGYVRDVAAAMRSLDVVVHASTEPEPFGMVIIEAMACARAVIASQAGGAAELFLEGQTALGHPAGDAAVLAQRIEQLASDAALRSRIGIAGRASVEVRHHGQRLARELRAVYGQGGDGPTSAADKAEMESCTVGD
ncbi:MAG TPA: glycosyltransferase family 4 protein [Bryobacteraceae bacterium]|nr:glycosyltransferase family 4 protein [Bryobacteraceae bacterium]